MFQLCRNADCITAISTQDFGVSDTVQAVAEESSAFFGARFHAGRSDNVSTLVLSAWPKGKLADGDAYSILISDADSSTQLFSHSESVTYRRSVVCEERCMLARISVSGHPDSGAGL